MTQNDLGKTVFCSKVDWLIELVILSDIIVCLHSSMSLNNEHEHSVLQNVSFRKNISVSRHMKRNYVFLFLICIL